MAPITAQYLEKACKERLEASHVEVTDTSGMDMAGFFCRGPRAGPLEISGLQCLVVCSFTNICHRWMRAGI